MMKIKSTVPVLVDSREQVYKKVSIEITNWTYNPTSGYTISIRDYIDAEEGVVNNPMQYSNTLKSKSVTYSLDKVNFLYSNLDLTEDESTTYSERLDLLMSKSLLLVTQTELSTDGTTIYGILPSQWAIVTE